MFGVVAACAASGLMAYAVRGRSSSIFGPSVWRGDAARPEVALTFDDGPSESTPALLDLLAEEGVTATFFQVGRNVERLPEIARAVAVAGHEIGNHGYAHRFFHFRSARFMETELARAQQAIIQATGTTPKLMRAPYGVRWFGLGRVQRKLDLMGVMWTVIGYDWKRTADAIVPRVAGRLGNGSMICLHDGRGLQPDPFVRETLEAVRRLIPIVRARGLKLVTVSQLICPKT
jgi:peptidoglycan-N-acetylglucosamine deacetylase